MTAQPDQASSGYRPGQPPTVTVAIVNYCTAGLTIDCLRSLQNEILEVPGSSVVVVDNASPDGSGPIIGQAIADNNWQSWARLVVMPRNGGFAYGNNAVIREALGAERPPRYVWLLNSDTVVRPGAMRPLVDFLDARPEVGIAGSCLEDPDGTQQRSAFRFHSALGEFESSARLGPITRLLQRWAVSAPMTRTTMRYDWLAGASMMIKADVFRRIGLLDETYFLYYEETDFCRQAASAGWQCWLVAESRVVHLVGASSGVTNRSEPMRRRSQYWFDSRRHYFVKNHGRPVAIGADLALAAGVCIARLRGFVERRNVALPERFLFDLVRNSAAFRSTRTASTV